MKRIRLIVSYDGTNYSGWQIQKNAVTIEEVLTNALRCLLNENVSLIGASRTDAGVHANGNVAVFDTATHIPPEKIALALNKYLPDDIKIQKSEEVPGDWHPRHCKSTKTYEYRILNRKISDPLRDRYSCFMYVPLDIEKMKKAAFLLVGEHDFSSFCSVGGSAKSNVRAIYSIDVSKDEDMVSIRVRGNGFLYNMVRIIAGTLMDVGMGIYPPEYVTEILESGKREKAGRTAPAKGLTLVEIEYIGG